MSADAGLVATTRLPCGVGHSVVENVDHSPLVINDERNRTITYAKRSDRSRLRRSQPVTVAVSSPSCKPSSALQLETGFM